MANTTVVDVVDFEPFLDGSQKGRVGEAVVESFKRTGFVYLENHGLDKDKIEGMFRWSRDFFAQPMEVKQLAPHPPSGTHHRGYSAPGIEKVVQHLYDRDEIEKSRAQAPDVKENFECGREDDPAMPNIWLPDGVLPGFKEACLEFYWLCREVELNVLRAIALGFHLREDYFVQYHQAADNQLRLLHYPSVPQQSLEKDEVVRIGAHSDFGTITLLLQDAVGGLEIEDPKQPGVFQRAPPIEGSLIVNAGDFLQRWSNDTIRSAIHRVRAPSHVHTADGMTPERYSIPYFCSADFSSAVDCVPGTYSEENPKKYEPISAMGYIMQRLASNY
ncbi:hypothetical protein EIP91_000253 [Steccherinum ochraceum]|uniref:Fe2OG dioxygenase domain-containing protein n=1 Tax=Steccherinum ochraceum TaxID=92696 RepID=A0A4R0RJM5_9APHY|nr:hypothetical protein EIP91_000253 [Steccherinum ochraceum]